MRSAEWGRQMRLEPEHQCTVPCAWRPIVIPPLRAMRYEGQAARKHTGMTGSRAMLLRNDNPWALVIPAPHQAQDRLRIREKGKVVSTSPDILFLCYPGETRDWFWRGKSRDRARELGYEVRLSDLGRPLDSKQWASLLLGVEAVLTTWGSPRLDREVLSCNDTLKIVGHVGGTVASIVSPELYERGVKVCTANLLMSRSVAEYGLMMTLVGLRRVLQYASFGKGGSALNWLEREPSVIPQDSVIGIWGYGDVARWLIRFLKPLEPREIIVCDDFLDEGEAQEEGIRKVQFDELFEQSDLVHCLTALTEENKGRVGKKQLDLLRDDAILVNCGRAALIQEQALIDALREGRFTAIMDVFETEPLAEDHPYQSMPNVILTPHNAGYGRDEYYLAAMLDEFDRFFNGRPLQTEVSLERAIAMTNSSLMRRRS